MNIITKIYSWLFGRKGPEVFAPLPPIQPKPVKSESIPLSQLDKKRNRIKVWRNKTFKKKANRIPFAKWAEPEKYF